MEKIQNSYETVLVISLKLGDEGVAAMVQKFKDLIEANATLESVDEWGKRRLAYLINKMCIRDRLCNSMLFIIANCYRIAILRNRNQP